MGSPSSGVPGRCTGIGAYAWLGEAVNDIREGRVALDGLLARSATRPCDCNRSKKPIVMTPAGPARCIDLIQNTTDAIAQPPQGDNL